MARPIEFDRNAALNAAMQQFWEEGYEASSIQKLLTVMGINRGSLYGSFGDKESLFKDVVDCYEQMLSVHAERTLTAIEHPLEAIEAFLLLRYQAPRRMLARGCLFVSSVSELSHIEPQLARLVAKKLKKIELAIAARLAEAQQQGLVCRQESPELLASFLTVMTDGLALRSKVTQNKDEMQQLVRFAMKALH